MASNRAENLAPGPRLSGATLVSHDSEEETLSTDEDEFWDNDDYDRPYDDPHLPIPTQGSGGAHSPSRVSSGPSRAFPGPSPRLLGDGASQGDRNPPPAYQLVHTDTSGPLCPGSQSSSLNSDCITSY